MQVAEVDYQISALKAKESDTWAGVVKGTCVLIGMMKDHLEVRGSAWGRGSMETCSAGGGEWPED